MIDRLKRGNTIIYTGDAPAGWRRVEISGSFTAYAHTRTLRPRGREHPRRRRKMPQVLTVAQAGDKTEVVGLAGSDWCQIRLEKKLQGFIATGANAKLCHHRRRPMTAHRPREHHRPRRADDRQHGRHARLFAGRLVLAKRAILNPNPPYDYQLIDASATGSPTSTPAACCSPTRSMSISTV